jgi:hypothetical protein
MAPADPIARRAAWVATRKDRRADNVLAAIKLAATRIWLATYQSTT